MGYEISEGAAAAALLMSNVELEKLKTDNLLEYAEIIHGLVKDKTKIKMSGPERVQYTKWFDPSDIGDTGLTAIVHGVSAAKGIKKWFKSSQHKESTDTVDAGKVYLTGGVWDSDIDFLQVKVNDWTDYNSSDLIVIKGNCYYGISLKKKTKKSSANPPMINKSFVSLLTELGKKPIADYFYKSRIEFFGGIVEKEITSGALVGSTTGIKTKVLFQMQVKNPYKNEWVNLIDLKGYGALNLKSGTLKYEWKADKESVLKGVSTKTLALFKKNKAVMDLFAPKPIADTQHKMRKNVNRRLGNINIFYNKILAIAKEDKLAKKIGKKLVSAVLKTELQEAVNAEIEAGKHFGFALVTALGKVDKGKITAQPNDAIVKNNLTIQAVLGSMMEAHKKDNWKLSINTKLSEKKRKDAENKGNAPPAKLFFSIGIGDIDLLALEVRYKGSFSPSPQFIGGITKTFEKLLEAKDNKLYYEFGKACNG